MYDQPRYDPYEPSAFFDDGLSARPIEPGTVARSDPAERGAGSVFATGRAADSSFVDELPFPFDRAVLERGQGRYQIFCAPCHGLDGAGRGMIVERGFSPPPALFEEKVRIQPLGYYFDVITHGHGAMYGYAARIPARDRWTVAAYLRALQLSQRADASDLTEADRQALEKAAAEPGPAAPGDAAGGEAHP
jgi:mono/diheme cytochrome c family protein